MKITVWAKYEFNFCDDLIEIWKKDYNDNPKTYFNLSDKDDFIQWLEDEIYKKTNFDIVVNDNEGYSDLCKKWNEM